MFLRRKFILTNRVFLQSQRRTEWKNGAGNGFKQPLSYFHTHVNLFWDERRNSNKDSRLPAISNYHTTAPRQETIVAVALGVGAVSAVAYAGSSAADAYREYKASLPSPEELEEARQEEEEKAQKDQAEKIESGKKAEPSEGPRENVFSKWFGVGVGSKYYEGGFEETMTRREAARILGVRESSPPSRIKLAHRRLLILNHPDTGGSTYLSGKINEAKELLLKGKSTRASGD